MARVNAFDRATRPRRSFIFTPGLRADMYPKALASGADIVCVELEDGIAPKDKPRARETALSLFDQAQEDDGIERMIRINSMRERFGIDHLLTEQGHSTRLHVIIETNEGLEAVFDIAKCSMRIDALFFGAVDMSAELRCKNSWENLLYARSRVVHAAASAGLDAIDVPFLDLDDDEGMQVAAELARELGYVGKGAIHPRQIPVLNQVFTPTSGEIERARRIANEFEAADTGLVVIDGKLIEKPVLREMHRVISIADRMSL
jgi:(S)-citramalyl-CoA lyase